MTPRLARLFATGLAGFPRGSRPLRRSRSGLPGLLGSSLVGLVPLVAGCRAAPAPSAFLVVEAAAGSDLDLGGARVEGRGVRAVTVSAGRLVVERDAHAAGGLAVHGDGACPLRVADTELVAGETVHRTLSPWLDFGEPEAQVGFGNVLKIVARPGCAEASNTHVAWTQTSGATLSELKPAEDGQSLVLTMPDLDPEVVRAAPWGIVPISPRTRGAVELRAAWSGDGGTAASHSVHVGAAARSRGLPNVAVNTRLYLSGAGFRVVSAPAGSRAAVEPGDGVAAFMPDTTGTFALADARGRPLKLYAGRYEDTPLDCGRSGCHAGIAASARSNPMATILQRGLDGPFAGNYPSCALGCHTVGEPGLADGGFAAVNARFGFGSADLRRAGFHDLPAPLRRLGGVGCLACHGPGTVAEATSRHALLRADVCATCHDAPPRYGHVVAWKSSRMARSDADPRTRADPSCARCHTTWGFLGRSDRKPPDDAPPSGISCAACHDVHPAPAAAEPRVGATCAAALRREAPFPALLDGAITAEADKSRACFSCHAPSPDEMAPAASAAAIWAGRGGLDPATGGAFSGSSPHRAVAGGCIGCHRSGPEGLGRGAGHAFAARPESCTACHAERADRTIRDRALLLWRRWSGRDSATIVVGSDPPHAAPARLDLSTPRGRAAWNVALVLEDPAADRHNAPYARALLDVAERALATGAAPPARGEPPRTPPGGTGP